MYVSEKDFKYTFSKLLINSAVEALEEIATTAKVEDQYKVLEVYASINQAMELVIEQYLNEENESIRERFLAQLKERIAGMDMSELQKTLNDPNTKFLYKGKEKPEA